MLATVRHESVAGFQISAASTAIRIGELHARGVAPPIVSSSPVGSVTVLWNARGFAIDAADEITGLGPFRSIFTPRSWSPG